MLSCIMGAKRAKPVLVQRVVSAVNGLHMNHGALNLCRFNVAPVSQTVVQYPINIEVTSCVCWVLSELSKPI